MQTTTISRLSNASTTSKTHNEMKRILLSLLAVALVLPCAMARRKAESVKTDREKWVDVCYAIAAPVLENMAKGELQKNMDLELAPTWDGRDPKVTYMECFGRLMAGITPWLALPDDGTPEGAKRRQLHA